jgi:glycosyltransferase involved in cell wall biosynthesis
MQRRRLLALSSQTALGAAVRFRVLGHAEELDKRGISLALSPFLDDEYVRNVQFTSARVAKARALVRFVARRARQAIGPIEADAIFVQREAAFLGPEWFEQVLVHARGLPMIFDYDDAIWMHTPELPGGQGSPNPIAARLLKSPSKTGRLIRLATAVIAGSEYLAQYARRRGANVHVVPTVVSRAEFVPARAPGALAGEVPVVGWIGTPSTSLYLPPVLAALEALAAEGKRFRLRLIGAKQSFSVRGVEVEHVPWSLADEVRNFQSLDIGLAPSATDAWAEGKCSFKQLQYMACGVPVVTTLSGSARDFVIDGQNALIAGAPAEWAAAVGRLLRDAELRTRLSVEGRALVEKTYCSEVQSPRVAEIVESVIEGRRG